MNLFYTPDISGARYTLNEDESHHCHKVLRLGDGDIVHMIDGKGGLYTGRILESHAKRTTILIIDKDEGWGKRDYTLHIAIAPTKNIERFEWFLEKATEIGIDEITPLICDRSERKEVKKERLTKVITSAVKQSLKAYHPQLNEVVKFKNFVKDVKGQKFIAHCMDTEKQSLKQILELRGNYTILIGPEGDFSPSELSVAEALGFRPVSLGTSRLRTETAALEACFEVNFLNREE